MTEGAGKITTSESGEFIHTGGWLFVHDNNSCEINLLECEDRDSFGWDKLEPADTETQSNAGRAAAKLQEKTVRLLQKRR